MRIIRMAGFNDFEAAVNVSIYGLDRARPGMLEDETHWKAWVKFSIAVDYRDWGIKGITVTPAGTVTVPVSLTSEIEDGKTETLNVSFEASQLKQDRVGSDAVTLGDVDIWVNPDMTVDYGRSSITVYGPTRRE